MGPYGSVGAHIKTGRSHMAQDHFKTRTDPKKGYKSQNNIQNVFKPVGVVLGELVLFHQVNKIQVLEVNKETQRLQCVAEAAPFDQITYISKGG